MKRWIWCCKNESGYRYAMGILGRVHEYYKDKKGHLRDNWVIQMGMISLIKSFMIQESGLEAVKSFVERLTAHLKI